MPFETIGFYGLGLIGGSIAKTLKEKLPSIRLLATSGHLETVKEAHRAGVIENDTLLPPDAFLACDLVFLCAPVSKNIAYLEELARATEKRTLLTDVGSVKGTVHEAAERLSLSDRFIGGHPMTGSEKTGFSHASETLLENAYYLLTPEPKVEEARVAEFAALVRTLGAIPLVLDATRHDQATAAVSHLPHVLAAALVNLVRESEDESGTLKRIAAGGFRDITRIASSSPEMWESICLENQEQILFLMDRFTEVFSDARERIASGDGEKIRTMFTAAKNYRDSLNLQDGGKHTIHELFSDLTDTEGQIARVTTLLAGRHINLKNIGIVHNREFEQGVLHIEFYDAAGVRDAAALLSESGYTIYQR